MEDNNDIIPIGQMIFILVLTMVGTGILTLPRDLAEAVPHDHWLVLLAGGGAAIASTFIHGNIIKLQPREQFFDVLSHGFTRPVAYVLGAIYMLYFLTFCALVTRVFGEVMKAFLFKNTPIEVINVSFLAASVYLGRKGIEVLGRVLEFLIPLLILFIVFIFGLSFIRSDLYNLLPTFQISFNEFIKGIPTTILSFAGYEILLVFGPYLKKPKDATKGYIAVVSVLIFYLLITTATLAQFGPLQVKRLLWPTLDLFDIIETPGLFIENVQVIVMTLWVLTAFTTASPFHLGATIMLKSLTKSKDQAYLSAPLLPIIYFVSIIPESVSETYEFLKACTRYGTTALVFVVPLLLLISLLIQDKMKKGARSNV